MLPRTPELGRAFIELDGVVLKLLIHSFYVEPVYHLHANDAVFFSRAEES